MKYALVDKVRTEAQKGLNGICPICHEPLVPRCGSKKINHWAHKKSTHCDKWWESETEWHRSWKNKFPQEWQEVVAFDKISGEKHIADIKTNYGIVYEFQHSYIKEEERISRENFYINMAWIVDGTRRKRDYIKFLEAFEYGSIWNNGNNEELWILENGNNYLPTEWLNSRFPVYFDFKGLLTDSTNDLKREYLWCLLPIRGNNINILIKIARDVFVDCVKNKGGILFKDDLIKQEANSLIQRRYYLRRYRGY